MTAVSRHSPAIPRWVPLPLAVATAAGWTGAAIFAGGGSWPVALACAALAFLFGYVTAWMIVILRRPRSTQLARLSYQMTQFMPAIGGGVAAALLVAAVMAFTSDYDPVFVGFCVLGAAFFAAWAVWAPLEVRRLRRRFSHLSEGSSDAR